MTYCKAGVTPGHQNVAVFDLATGAKVDGVTEINTEEGWLKRHIRKDGRLKVDGVGGVMVEKVAGRFEIRPIN